MQVCFSFLLCFLQTWLTLFDDFKDYMYLHSQVNESMKKPTKLHVHPMKSRISHNPAPDVSYCLEQISLFCVST